MREKRWTRYLDYYVGVPLGGMTGAAARAVDCLTRSQRRAGRARSILLIKLAAVGDTVLLTPALVALRQRFPEAHLAFLCSPVNDQVVAHVPFLDEVMRLHPDSLADLVRVAREVRAKQFDLVIDFEQWMRTTAIVAALSGAPRRLGFDTEGQRRCMAFTQTVRPAREGHEVDNFLALAGLADATAESALPRLWLSEADRAQAASLLSAGEGRSLVAIHPGCGAKGKPREWARENYARLADRLVDECGVCVAVTGGRGEEQTVVATAALMRHTPLTLAGNLSFTGFAAVLERCDVLVCGNTGALHIAAAVGTPTVALHGPTNPRKWGPVGAGHEVVQSPIGCSPCLTLGFDYGCKPHPCLGMITVGRVFDAVARRLERRKWVNCQLPIANCAL